MSTALLHSIPVPVFAGPSHTLPSHAETVTSDILGPMSFDFDESSRPSQSSTATAAIPDTSSPSELPTAATEAEVKEEANVPTLKEYQVPKYLQPAEL